MTEFRAGFAEKFFGKLVTAAEGEFFGEDA